MYWLKTDKINTIHGFSTRYGGVSHDPFLSLNLGGVDDLKENIDKNRLLALGDLNINMSQVSYLNQIHSNHVCMAQPGIQTGDALVTNAKNMAIAVATADCYPILFYDKVNKVIGAAHCGWKGTVAKIVKNTIEEMVKLGANTSTIIVAIGQGISKANYEVSENIITQFKEANFSGACWENRHLDLLEANKQVAIENGIHPENIWCMNRCTTEDDFFSYRRDNGKTGRMWAIIMLK